MEENYKLLLDKYPFISYIVYGGNDYIGIIQNVDDLITTMYDISVLKTDEQRLRFLELGEIYWWESNRQLPINVFLRNEWKDFKCCLRTMNTKDVEIKCGPYVSLKEIALKRSKKRSITLVRRLG